jgi:hypothetical protein
MCAFLAVDYVDALFRLAGGSLAGLFLAEHLPRLLGGPVVLAVVFFLIWNYWQGENWARIAVLVWSFLLGAEEVSTMIEHNGNLTAAMSHPLSFLKLALAVFLLYWLNTRPLRAFFRGAPTAIDHLHHHLAGRLCTAVEKEMADPDPVWHLAFEHDGELTLHCPWRIVVDDNLAFASSVPGNPEAELAGEETPQQLLQNIRVKAVRVTPRTSDLFVTFEMGIELQTWSSNPHSEQWRYSDPVLTVVADAVGVNSRTVTAPAASEDTAVKD